MPYEGAPGAYWALLGPGVDFRRSEYDLDEAAARYRASGDPLAERHGRAAALAADARRGRRARRAAGLLGMTGPIEWLESLSPWPADGFGLDRMRALLTELGEPQLAYPAVHVVGTNGKSTATRTIEALLHAEGLSVGATVSPHVRSWGERITVDGEEADVAGAVERIRPAAERLGATQFETITAAALAEFAARGVDAAVVEAGLGGRLDATNVLRTRVVLLTNVGPRPHRRARRHP